MDYITRQPIPSITNAINSNYIFRGGCEIKQEDTPKNVEKRILEYRKKLALTQEQAAESASVSHQFFLLIEIGKKNMQAENIVKVANALRVSTDYLLTGKRSNQ